MAASEKTDHMAMWDRLMPTDPKYTKAFDRGGFKGTATNGTYIVQRLTEEFGPCGVGWRFVLDDEQIVEGHTLDSGSGDKAKLHTVRGHLEYRYEEMPGAVARFSPVSSDGWFATSPQFGQTMLVGRNKYGNFTDEEAPKKSITDCISKCAVLLGIAADVHLGLFDDVKYVNDRKKQEAAEAATAEAPDPSKHHRAPTPPPPPPPPPPQEPEPAVPAPMTDKQPGTTDDKTISVQVYNLVVGTCETAKTQMDLDDIQKHNAASLKVLERSFPDRYEKLRGIVKAARARLEGLNQDLPEFEDMPR